MRDSNKGTNREIKEVKGWLFERLVKLIKI